jgi:hypothetical protein
MEMRRLTITGGSIAVVALGSTGCSMVCSSSPSAEALEFDLSLVEVCVSALCSGFAKREEILPLCRTEDYLTVSRELQSDRGNSQLSADVAFRR